MSKKEGGILFLSIIKINICQSTLEDDEVERVKNGAENLLLPELYKTQSIDDGIFLISKSRWSCVLGKI